MKKSPKIRKVPHDKDGTNIQVVLRCRGRNSQEIEANSPVIVEPIANSRQRDVLIKTTNKVYSFDRVFGPDAKQEELYQEVAQPILEQVLLGYNCTIFAYGQTGSGKTYTMEGDLSQRSIGPYSNAGIIPRAIHKLFEALDNQGLEYSVKVSLIELYNEELRDLLNVTGGTSNSNGNPNPLRIYEDHQGSGVIVQNIEETLVNNAEDGIRVLQEGTRNRSSAATKCNEKSSRSHCIFTLTVRIKEEVTGGEEVLTVGKLNLVDLAGSENINRSGAENARAREAGMINQSLLTLGRVINQLVDHSPHVPYRESKLTRLLKDSLGGKTKTCIVATVSVAKLSQEEIVSTLDYASRAKNIRNKPEANQRLNPKVLLREYEATIERLKADLNATRTQKGVYLSQETYNILVDEKQSKSDRVEELGRDMETLRSSLDERTAEVTSMKTLLQEKDSQLTLTKRKLQDLDSKVKQQLHDFQKQLSMYTAQVEDTIEQNIDSLNHCTDTLTSLVTTGIDNQRDLATKIDNIRQSLQTSITDNNTKAKDKVHCYFKYLETGIHDFGMQLDQMSQFYEQDIRSHISGEEDYLTSQQKLVEKLRDNTLSTVTKELAALKEQHEMLQTYVEKEQRNYKREDQDIVNTVSGYLMEVMAKLTQERSSRLDGITGDVRGLLNQSGDQLRILEGQFTSALNSSLGSNSQRMHLVNEFGEHALLEAGKFKKMQEEMADLHSRSAQEKQHIQTFVETNQSMVDDSCVALETEVLNSSQALEKTIASAVATTIPASATITHSATDTTNESTPFPVASVTEGSPVVDVKVESSPMGPSTVSLDQPPSKPTKQTLVEVRKPALSDISNRQVKRKLTHDKHSQDIKSQIQHPNKKRYTLQK